jgi:ABC-type transport system involved in multi-copper enzyme maturation permease subunit
MAVEMYLQVRTGDHWWRGLKPMLRREHLKWWGTRRWLVQSIIWVALLNGLLAFALYFLPQMAAADGVPISQQEALDVGRQMFFGLGVLALALGAIVLLQDAIIEEKMNGTAEWLLSKPLARPAYLLAKLVPNILGMAVTMLLLPGVIGYVLFLTYEVGTFTLGGFLASGGIVALHLFFYITLVLMLGVLFQSRAPLLGVALLSLFGGSFIPVAQIVQFTPWKLGDLVVLPMMGEALPPIAGMMLASTALWSILFIAIAIWRFNKQEF